MKKFLLISLFLVSFVKLCFAPTSGGGGEGFDYKITYSKNSVSDLTGTDTSILTDLILIDTHIIQNGITHCYPMLQVQDTTQNPTITLYSYQPGDLDEYTKALLHMNGINGGTTFIDEMGHTVTAYGNIQISTTQSKFGGASGYFDGNGDYISLPNSDDWNVGNGDFTIEAWAYFLDTNYHSIWASNSDYVLGFFYQGGRMHYFASSNGTSWNLIIGDGTTNPGSGSIDISLNTWHHLAFVRHGDDWYGFVDGQQDMHTVVSGSVVVKNEPKNIGRWGNGGYWMYGYIDEFRFSKGIARWTSNFTPPTQEYSELLTSMTTLINGQDNSFTANTIGKYKIKIEGDSNLDYRGGVVYFK